MQPMNPPPEHRSSIFKDIENWQSAYNDLVKRKAELEESAEHEQNILEMINSFEQFCKDYINRFYDTAIKPEAATFPPDWLGSTIEKVLLGYWEPIRRAAEQYQIGYYKDLLDRGYVQLENFRMGRHQMGLDKPVVLYLEKTGVYKRYPFGNIYLIGIPLMDAYNDDWMAMWHELGHHLYWNSRINFENQSYYQGRQPNFFKQEIDDAVATLTAVEDEKEKIRRILSSWTEEIFADVVGAKIVGPEFVTAAWKKVSREVETGEDLFKSDGKHPSPFFLPYIRACVFGEQFLISQPTWEQRFGSLPFTQLLDNKTKAYLLKIENLLSAIKSFVNKIGPKLTNVRFESWFSGYSALDELVNFIVNDHPSYSPIEFARILLRPQIVEGGAGWTCANCGATNDSIYLWCQNCGAFILFAISPA